MAEDKPKKKPGPKSDRLVIEDYPGKALDRLVDKKPEAEIHHNWRQLDRFEKVTTLGIDPGVMYRCRACGHYSRSDSVPGPCPPPDGSPKLLG